MEYKIGEVSKILNISKEMIRYYEKQGILKPSRKEDNNYRTYSVMDVFLLMEIIRYQSIHFGIKDISVLLSNHYIEKYSQYLHDYYQEIDQDIMKKILLKERVKDLAERIETCQYNIAKYWIKKIPSYQLVFLTSGQGDRYEKIELLDENRNLLFSKERMVYVESIVLFDDQKETWWYGIQNQYVQALDLTLRDVYQLNEQTCLCTMIDMGEIGEFNRDKLNPIFEYIKENGYQVSGIPRGIIIGRGYEGKKFQRIMEIQIPIVIKH